MEEVQVLAKETCPKALEKGQPNATKPRGMKIECFISFLMSVPFPFEI